MELLGPERAICGGRISVAARHFLLLQSITGQNAVPWDAV
jgi:hypothetical protein